MAKIIKNDKNSVIVLDPYDYKGFRYHNSKVEAFNFLKTVNKHDFFIFYYFLTSPCYSNTNTHLDNEFITIFSNKG